MNKWACLLLLIALLGSLHAQVTDEIVKDFQFAFVNPASYVHDTASGVWSDGSSSYISTNVLASAYSCRDRVAHLVLLTVNDTLEYSTVGVKFDVTYTKSAGGVTFSDYWYGINTGDAAIIKNPSSSWAIATVPKTEPQTSWTFTARIDGLEAGEQVVLLLDAQIRCMNGSAPLDDAQFTLDNVEVYRADGSSISEPIAGVEEIHINDVSGENNAPVGLGQAIIEISGGMRTPDCFSTQMMYQDLHLVAEESFSYCIELLNYGGMDMSVSNFVFADGVWDFTLKFYEQTAPNVFEETTFIPAGHNSAIYAGSEAFDMNITESGTINNDITLSCSLCNEDLSTRKMIDLSIQIMGQGCASANLTSGLCTSCYNSTHSHVDSDSCDCNSAYYVTNPSTMNNVDLGCEYLGDFCTASDPEGLCTSCTSNLYIALTDGSASCECNPLAGYIDITETCVATPTPGCSLWNATAGYCEACYDPNSQLDGSHLCVCNSGYQSLQNIPPGSIASMQLQCIQLGIGCNELDFYGYCSEEGCDDPSATAVTNDTYCKCNDGFYNVNNFTADPFGMECLPLGYGCLALTPEGNCTTCDSAGQLLEDNSGCECMARYYDAGTEDGTWDGMDCTLCPRGYYCEAGSLDPTLCPYDHECWDRVTPWACGNYNTPAGESILGNSYDYCLVPFIKAQCYRKYDYRWHDEISRFFGQSYGSLYNAPCYLMESGTRRDCFDWIYTQFGIVPSCNSNDEWDFYYWYYPGSVFGLGCVDQSYSYGTAYSMHMVYRHPYGTGCAFDSWAKLGYMPLQEHTVLYYVYFISAPYSSQSWYFPGYFSYPSNVYFVKPTYTWQKDGILSQLPGCDSAPYADACKHLVVRRGNTANMSDPTFYSDSYANGLKISYLGVMNPAGDDPEFSEYQLHVSPQTSELIPKHGDFIEWTVNPNVVYSDPSYPYMVPMLPNGYSTSPRMIHWKYNDIRYIVTDLSLTSDREGEPYIICPVDQIYSTNPGLPYRIVDYGVCRGIGDKLDPNGRPFYGIMPSHSNNIPVYIGSNKRFMYTFNSAEIPGACQFTITITADCGPPPELSYWTWTEVDSQVGYYAIGKCDDNSVGNVTAICNSQNSQWLISGGCITVGTSSVSMTMYFYISKDDFSAHEFFLVLEEITNVPAYRFYFLDAYRDSRYSALFVNFIIIPSDDPQDLTPEQIRDLILSMFNDKNSDLWLHPYFLAYADLLGIGVDEKTACDDGTFSDDCEPGLSLVIIIVIVVVCVVVVALGAFAYYKWRKGKQAAMIPEGLEMKDLKLTDATPDATNQQTTS